MSQVKLTLRPPPNVEFVHGYPGIPPGGPERPQAAVKGAIEVRVGQQGVKAKWVRIELRKVETLPGGGITNTFYDFVGPSPVNLWGSSDEYELLKTRDFPFSIRIPESIPPSIMLENRAGIQYELVASVCTKGKRSFFRRRKSSVISIQEPIIIDKHELHSTWPIYCQPETRQIVQDGCTLIVDRTQTCYGPGDRLAVVALFRSETVANTILRGFELTLKETTIFRAGPYGKKSSAPVVKVLNISDNKLPINGPVFVGSEHRAELTCSISPNHTTTSLNSARHIDVTYVLSVKAIVDHRPPIVMDLPVIISNWQRAVSQEAIRRIGPAPALSLLPLAPPQQSIVRSETPSQRSPPPAATLPLSSKDNSYLPTTNYSSLPNQKGGYSTRPAHNINPSLDAAQLDDFARPVLPPAGTTVGRGPGSATSSPNKFTVANALPTEMPPPDANNRQRTGSAPTVPAVAPNNTSTRPNGTWLTAGDEKQKLFEDARKRVEMVQNKVAKVTTPPPQVTSPPTAQTTTPAPKKGPWVTAEEEKLRLFNKAQEAAKKTHGLESYSPPSSLHGRNNSESNRAAELSNQPSTTKEPSKKQNTAAERYAQAMVARDQAMARQQSANSVLPKSPPKAGVPQYLSAEEEKAALQRYRAAKDAVGRTQNGGNYVAAEDAGSLQVAPNGPTPYEYLYPDSKNGASSSTPSVPANDLPPPFEVSANFIPQSHLPEKERVRRAYAEQDAVALAREIQNAVSANPPPFSQVVPAPQVNGNHGLSEKELLRRKFDAQDNQALNIAGRTSPPQSLPQPPPRSNSTTNRTGRPTPTPPTSPAKILTAAEEKALMKAKYAAADARAAAKQQQQKENGAGAGPSRPTSSVIPPPSNPPAPPPLMPRPPVEYIQETQEEDARVSRLAINGVISIDDGLATSRTLQPNGSSNPPLDVRPFSPFNARFDAVPPPPLPPKPAGEQ